jgi:hypothetical protein
MWCDYMLEHRCFLFFGSMDFTYVLRLCFGGRGYVGEKNVLSKSSGFRGITSELYANHGACFSRLGLFIFPWFSLCFRIIVVLFYMIPALSALIIDSIIFLDDFFYSSFLTPKKKR